LSGPSSDPSDHLATQRRQRLIGIALMCATVACFACLDTTAKYLGAHMNVLQVVWARYTSAFLFALVIYNPLSHPNLLRTRRPWLQFGRGWMLIGSTLLNFLALRWLQLDEALAIMFATPFLVSILSGPMLNEWIGWRRWIAVLVGFSGVLLVTRPGFGGMHPAAFISVVAAVCYALYAIMTRIAARTDSNETSLFYGNLLGAVVMLPIVPFVWTAPQDWFITALLVATGIFGSVGHFMLIAGHRLAPASLLSPFIYTQLIWVITLGYLVFGQTPTGWTLAGAAVVIASGLYVLYRERVVRGGEEA
jgi:drug/metabolite transporter (DMT)-like permease